MSIGEIETLNKFLVGGRPSDDSVVVGFMPPHLTPVDALLLAAYLVALAEPAAPHRFEDVLRAVRAT